MQHPEALILRRCHPVPVTFADLRAVANVINLLPTPSVFEMEHNGGVVSDSARRIRVKWSAAMKEVTGALDEVYAVVDGREVRVAAATHDSQWSILGYSIHDPLADDIATLMNKADRAGYWERPHEVRLDLQERPVSRDEVAHAVLVGQEYVERSGGAR